MVFVELTPFIAFRTGQWSDEDLRGLQNFLLAAPDAGDVIPGGSGLRKLRWAVRGHGKRGGARVIYYNGQTKPLGQRDWISAASQLSSQPYRSMNSAIESPG